MLSDKELEILNEKVRLSKAKSLRAIILSCILEKEIFGLDIDSFREMSANIGRTTGSINQIAKRVNSTSVIYKDDIADLKDMIKKQGKKIYEIRKKSILWLIKMQVERRRYNGGYKNTPNKKNT